MIKKVSNCKSFSSEEPTRGAGQFEVLPAIYWMIGHKLAGTEKEKKSGLSSKLTV